MVGRKPGKLVGLDPLGSSNLPLGALISFLDFNYFRLLGMLLKKSCRVGYMIYDHERKLSRAEDCITMIYASDFYILRFYRKIRLWIFKIFHIG